MTIATENTPIPFQHENRFIEIIVNTFGAICLAIVIIPTTLTGLASILMLFMGKEGPAAAFLGLILTAVVFLATSFIAGSALTLLQIAHNTRTSAELLTRLVNQRQP